MRHSSRIGASLFSATLELSNPPRHTYFVSLISEKALPSHACAGRISLERGHRSKRKCCVRDPAYARTLGLLRCIPSLFLLCFNRGYRSQQTFRLDCVLVLVLCRGPGVVRRRV